MTIDELISALDLIRIEHGNLRVLVHDGFDPSDLAPVKLIKTEIEDFFDGQYRHYSERAVRLLTG